MYRIILEKPAEKFFRKLDKKEQERIGKKILELENNPELGKPLTANLSGLRSLRIGKYRIIYKIDKKIVTIFILDMGHRKDIYD
ncbi:type II toxin-antitoxin system RelE/ParE family toxin [Candidatus Pacearchaeota archaeon]|nr:type II toxin-antitoxin system RelE/ParE family toxin [Candidatus Pacearchaeota archaeon]